MCLSDSLRSSVNADISRGVVAADVPKCGRTDSFTDGAISHVLEAVRTGSMRIASELMWLMVLTSLLISLHANTNTTFAYQSTGSPSPSYQVPRPRLALTLRSEMAINFHEHEILMEGKR